MSAIFGIYYLDGREVESRELEAMSMSLRHRGTDGDRIRVDGSIGLGHRMRWTTPESLHEILPLKRAESSLIITCDARIDNREELIKQLAFPAKSDGKIADSEVILRSYEKWGEDCLSRLVGDFVFAIWNPRENKLFCARDPLGLKHFYYCYIPGQLFALASEIKALLTIDQVPEELDEDHLADYLVVSMEDKEATFYKHIRRLPATSSLSVNGQGIRIRSYWQPDYSEIRLKTDSEYHEAFLEQFRAAVKCRLRSAYPIGSMLSGGLDSSAVTCVAAEMLKESGKPLHSFSAVFPTIAKIEPKIDERHFIKSVVGKIGCIPHDVIVDEGNPLQNMDKIIWHTDHPVGPLNVYMETKIFEATQNAGVKILLTGHDGDATVTYGYQEFQELAKRGQFFRLIREASALSKNMPQRNHSLKSLAWHIGVKRAVPTVFIKAWRIARLRSIADSSNRPVPHRLHFDSIRPQFKDRDDLRSRYLELHDASYPEDSAQSVLHWKSLTGGLFTNMHEQVEKLSAAYEIEARHPFFDRRLIEFCVRLPPGQRIYRGWTRSIFRFAMEGILPPDVQWRVDKAKLGAYIKINLLKYGEAELDRAVDVDAWKLEKYIDTSMLKTALTGFKTDPNRKDEEALFLLSSMYLMKWLEHSGFAAN